MSESSSPEPDQPSSYEQQQSTLTSRAFNNLIEHHQWLHQIPKMKNKRYLPYRERYKNTETVVKHYLGSFGYNISSMQLPMICIMNFVAGERLPQMGIELQNAYLSKKKNGLTLI